MQPSCIGSGSELVEGSEIALGSCSTRIGETTQGEGLGARDLGLFDLSLLRSSSLLSILTASDIS